MAVPSSVSKWRPLAEKFAGVFPVLSTNEILAIIWSESFGNPLAYNPGDPSWGLMQVTMPIAKEFAGVLDKSELFIPDINVRAGSGFLAYLKSKYAKTNPLTDPQLAWVAGYNEGEGNLLTKKIRDPNYIKAFLSHLQELNFSVDEVR